MDSHTIAIIGQGYVGLPLTLLAASKGHTVIGLDYDQSRIAQLQFRQMPFEDARLEKQLKNTTIHFTTDYKFISAATDIIVCVPTPVLKNTTPDLSPVEGAARSIAKYLRKDQLVVLESTVNPSVTERIMGKILERESGLVPGRDFYLAHCPERINPGDLKWPVEKISRVVGATGKIGLERAIDLYSSLIDVGTHEVDGVTYPVKVTPMRSIEAAELVKMLENTMADLVIAGVNQVAPLCNKRGIDLYEVLAAMETKNFSFFRKYPRPGAGVGGHCIPVDPWYLIHQGDEEGFPMELYRASRKVNDSMPAYTASLVADGLNDIERPMKNSIVTVLGISYKENVDDIRDTPTFPLIDQLRSKGAYVRAYDPHVSRVRIPQEYHDFVAPTMNEALTNAHAVVVVTAHKEFKEQLSGSYLREHNIKVVIDGRNCISQKECQDAGIIFKGVGKIPRQARAVAADFSRIFQIHGNGRK
ncbi:MAG TPA: nucleotide sugar dehydrogenase [Candidatus Binatia bacterium]|nr:nucleotide sugar dehydrogenase [Candidatus Binatia bacterium]